MVADKKYTACANIINGMPDETRELIFDTIKFVRKLPKTIDATGALCCTISWHSFKRISY